MDQIIPNLWLGDKRSALDKETLDENNIKYVVSVMRGLVKTDLRLVKHQIALDDSYTSDILTHLPSAIKFIASALESGDGVLVHCMAGISRSPSIVAAYLMYAQSTDLGNALAIIKDARPIVSPNDSFMSQLELFHGLLSGADPAAQAATRMYYLEKVVQQVLDGNDFALGIQLYVIRECCVGVAWANLPTIAHKHTTLSSNNMDQIIPNLWLGDMRSALDKKTLDEKNIKYVVSAMRGLVKTDLRLVKHQIALDDTYTSDILTHFPSAIKFIASALESGDGVLVHCMAGISRSPSIVGAYLMYTQNIDVENALAIIEDARPIVSPNASFMRQLELFHGLLSGADSADKATRMYYLEKVVQQVLDGNAPSSEAFPDYPGNTSDPPGRGGRQRRIRCKLCRKELAAREHMLYHGPSTTSVTASMYPLTSGRYSTGPVSFRLSNEGNDPSVTPKPPSEVYGAGPVPDQLDAESAPVPAFEPGPTTSMTSVAQGDDLPLSSALDATQTPLTGSNILAALKDTTSLRHTSLAPPLETDSSLIENPKCSGYFVEPLKWMEPFIKENHIVGKILCPNKKCRAKLGNYDWAGVACSCGEWVTPAFCIHRSKVDEISVRAVHFF